MKNKYFRIKGKYKDYIILVKSGNFWNCFFGDAVIIHFITGYKIVNNKVGFPSKVLNKVLNKIGTLNINYILVYELDDIIIHEYTSNSYPFYLHEYLSLYKIKKD